MISLVGRDLTKLHREPAGMASVTRDIDNGQIIMLKHNVIP